MPNRRLRALVALAAALAVGACNDSSLGPGFEGNVVGQPDQVDYVDFLNVDLSQMTRTNSGLYYRDLTVGSGDVAARNGSAVLRYSGWLPNGRQFDTGQITATLNGEGLIPGFEEGVIGMRVGGTRQLVIPPELAYGSAGSGAVIPGGATLVFRIELLAVSAPAPE